MRSSKSRSRNKSNRQRSLGNIVNRVFDSSGPEGKVRGTPQQIIDKYLMLARDAQLSNDRVAEQSFFQHAEHYTRMLGEAQREMAERQQQHNQNQHHNQRQNGDDGGDGNGNGHGREQGGRDQAQRENSGRDQNRDQPREHQSPRESAERDAAQQAPGAASPSQPSEAAQPRRGRPRREPAAQEKPAEGLPDAMATEGDDGPVATPEGATEKPARPKTPRTRSPRSTGGTTTRSRRKPAEEVQENAGGAEPEQADGKPEQG